MNFDRGEEIGRGGFGIVFEAMRDDEKRYALKQLNLDAYPMQHRPMLMKRFEREVRYQQQIDHPNVVPVIEADLDDDPPWFVMPRAEGSLKDDLEADRTLGNAPKKPLFDILAGLEALHQKGLCHRDLKPANVLRFPQQDGSILYAISDFGLATPGMGQTSTLTGSNMAGGTPLYRPPECANNFRRATEQADIYSFGAILHDIFSSGASRIPHSELRVSGPLKPVVEKCTKVQPLRRYSSIANLREELFMVLDNTVIEFFSREEENIIEMLNSKNELTDSECDRVFNLIDENADKNIPNDNIMKALCLKHIQSIHNSSKDMFQGLGEIYFEFIFQKTFDLEYCDVILSRSEIFFQLGDVGLKAKIALAMLDIGTRHDREIVERWFVKMAGPDCDRVLAERIKIEVIAVNYDFGQAMHRLERSIGVTADRLHPVLRELLPLDNG